MSLTSVTREVRVGFQKIGETIRPQARDGLVAAGDMRQVLGPIFLCVSRARRERLFSSDRCARQAHSSAGRAEEQLGRLVVG